MKKGDMVILFDNSKCEFIASVDTLTRKEVVFEVGERTLKEEQSKKDIHLFISIIKKDNLMTLYVLIRVTHMIFISWYNLKSVYNYKKKKKNKKLS